jgi:hypothetical protein
MEKQNEFTHPHKLPGLLLTQTEARLSIIDSYPKAYEVVYLENLVHASFGTTRKGCKDYRAWPYL